MKKRIISWPSFEVCNANMDEAFEYMCGTLFCRTQAAEGAILRYNPQNPGVECEPTIEKGTGKRISFQAKYFSSRVGYSKIEESAKKTIEYYSGKVDKVFLYCNKDLLLSGKQYLRIEGLLNACGIELVPVTNRAILDAVPNYPQIVASYFGGFFLSNEWFEQKLALSIAGLGKRYNGQFNICTETEQLLDLFYRTNDAAAAMNQKKATAVDDLQKNKWRYSMYRHAVDRAIDFIRELPDVDSQSLQECLLWSDLLEKCIADEIIAAEKTIQELEKQYQEKHEKDIRDQIYNLELFISIPGLLQLSTDEERFLTCKTIVLDGEAGMGKSHLLATMTQKAIAAGGKALLLLGQAFSSDCAIGVQIPQQLLLDTDIEELLLVLNELGERSEKAAVICIDALNESGNKGIWRSGLPGLLQASASLPFVKILVSYRTGYERLVLGEAVIDWIKSGEIVALHHQGLQNEGPEAVQDFLNHYGIPFSPEYYLQYEMANPLFLTLFCETFDGSLVDIGTLIKRIIRKADQDVQQSVGLDGDMHLLMHFLTEFAEKRIESDRHGILKEEVFSFHFWDHYGLSSVKVPFLSGLIKFGILSDFADQNDEYCSIGYNLVEDYICAEVILKRDRTKEETIAYIGEQILGANQEEINHFNTGLFIAACAKYSEKYREECATIIDSVRDEYDRIHLKTEYIKSFAWRKADGISAERFFAYIQENHISARTVFSLLFECAAKANHPLNARFLHKLLFEMTLPKRDSLWTIFVNELYSDEQRIVNLVHFLDKGGKIEVQDEEILLLLAITFSWMLSSSNRYLRDKTSKALVELLKKHFSLSLQLLSLFEGVNDPYVVQRLYGVVFGACVKRTDECKSDYAALAKYVYEHVFMQEYIYPDILMRDYARLIIERFHHEYSEDDLGIGIDLSRVKPPYSSKAIPVMKANTPSEDFGSGIAQIEHSMSPNYKGCGPGLYGDFGRYVFEASLSAFKDADIPNLYYYALHFIENELGYSDELFSAYDSGPKHYYNNRSDVKKTERIGKKYQWIAYYNILARLSDMYLVHEWSRDYRFHGPWDPYVRDFDPTLNLTDIIPPDTPVFCAKQNDRETVTQEFIPSESSDAIARDWSRRPCCFFDTQVNNIITKDSNGIPWVVLYQHRQIQSESNMMDDSGIEFKNGSQYIWITIEAFFAAINDIQIIKQLPKTVKLRNIYTNGPSLYQIYNREYYWSPSIDDILQDGWNTIEAPSKKTKTLSQKETVDDPLLRVLASYGGSSQSYTQIAQNTLLCKILPAYVEFLWEEQYDASQDGAVSFDLPCREIVEHLKLCQKEFDGYFYAEDGTLVAFDSKLSNQQNGLVIRKDYLDRFLKEKRLAMYWACTGEKQFFKKSHSQIWSEWEGIFHKNKGSIEGAFLPLETD